MKQPSILDGIIGKHNPLIYPAGKTWHAEKFRGMRDKGYNIQTDWINWPDEVAGDPRIWLHCHRDVARADLLILYCQDQKEDLRGALVEIGMAMGKNIPIYCIGTCQTVKPNATSDVAYTKHPLWHWVKAPTIMAGYREATLHYIRNYAPPLIETDNIVILPVAAQA